MQKVISDLNQNLQNIRSDRATPAMIENLSVEYYGSQVTLKETASISTPESRLLMIQPWDKNSIEDIEKALIKEGYAPTNDGQIIRISLPALTDERKKELEKKIGEFTEQARVRVRQERDKERNKIQEIKDEDERYRQLKKLDEDTEEINKKIDEIKNNKIQEILT